MNLKRYPFVFIVLVFCMFISCKKNIEKPLAQSMKSDEFHLSDSVLNDQEHSSMIKSYCDFVSSLDSSSINSVSKACEGYKKMLAGQDSLSCDSAFVFFQQLYERVELNINIQHQNDTTDYSPLIRKDKNTPVGLRKFGSELNENGFQLVSRAGGIYIEQNRDYIARHFYPYVSAALKEFLIQIERENKEGFAQGGVLVISPRKLVERVIWYELFRLKHPSFVFASRCADYHKAYFSYLLCGYAQTSVTDEKRQLVPYYQTAYNYLISSYPRSKTDSLVVPYFRALKQKQFTKAAEILKDYRIKGLLLSQK